jgi:hypothetical protein
MLIHDVHFRVGLGETAQVERRAAELDDGTAARPGGEVTVWKAIAGAPLGSFVMSRPLAGMEALIGDRVVVAPAPRLGIAGRERPVADVPRQGHRHERSLGLPEADDGDARLGGRRT